MVQGVLAISNTDSYPSRMWSLRVRLSVLFRLLRYGVAWGVVCTMLGLAPLAVAQDVHHELAAADSDGHEHSDTDICQWVQHHTAGSVDYTVPQLALHESIQQQDLPAGSLVLSAAPSLVGPSRAPPSR